MRILRAFLVHELRTQLLTLRHGGAAAAYVVLSCVPVAVAWALRARSPVALGPATVAATVYEFLPLLTALFAAVAAAEGLSRERADGSLVVVGMARTSNAGYVLRRWLAIEAVVLPLSAVAPLAGWLSVRPWAAPVDPAPFAVPWILHVAPLTAVVTAVFLGVGTLAGGLVPGVMALVLVLVATLTLGNDLLARTGRIVSGPGEWIFGHSLADAWLRQAVDDSATPVEFFSEATELPLAQPATEGAWDVAWLASQHLWLSALPIGFAVLALGLAACHVRRTRPDVRPIPIPQRHPLRTFLKALNALREGFYPDPAPTWRDRSLLAAGLLALGLASVSWWSRDLHFRELAEERLAAERSEMPAPTSGHVRVPQAAIDARLVGVHGLELRARLTLENRGDAAVRDVALALDRGLVPSAVRLHGRPQAHGRTWDRLRVELDPPLPAGGTAELEIAASGRPGAIDFELPDGLSFVTRWGRARERRVASELSDLSRSAWRPAVSRRRVTLRGPSLVPVPRYTAWSLDGRGDVLEDQVVQRTRIDLVVRAPAGVGLASSCGDVGLAEEGGSVLRSRCVGELGNLLVVGAPGLRVVESADTGALKVMTLPAHEGLVELHAPALRRIVELARTAWPALSFARSGVLVEAPPPQRADPWAHVGWRRGERSSVAGRLFVLPEQDWAMSRTLSPHWVAVGLVVEELESQRDVVDSERRFFKALYAQHAQLALRESPLDLVQVERGRTGSELRSPLLGPEVPEWSWWAYTSAARPRIAELHRRVGAVPFREALETFLSREGPPGTARELCAELAARSGKDVLTYLDEYLIGGAIPKLTLEDVAFATDGDGWRITGIVRNLLDGETTCTVSAAVPGGRIATSVQVPSGGAGRFELRSPRRPTWVALDLDRRCYRLQPLNGIGVVERVENEVSR